MDKGLEDAIDAAGREKVFSIMRAVGWTGYDRPPKWVWRAAVAQARRMSFRTGPARYVINSNASHP